MMIFKVICSIVFFLYALLMLYLAIGFRKIRNRQKTKLSPSGSNVFVSVIIPARNEADQIKRSLNSLKQQTYPDDLFEIIVVDDHSEDETAIVAKTMVQEFNTMKVVSLPDHKEAGYGKKYAIYQGILQAKGELIITTDADCWFHQRWLETMASYYSCENPRMILAPVLFDEGREGLFSGFQQLEFIGLMASAAGSLACKKPLMCNGANLGFSKKAYLEVSDIVLQSKFASGDDMFLMLAINHRFGSSSIRYLWTSETTVFTKPSASIAEFFRQRIRWASKTSGYKNSWLYSVALIVWMMPALLMLSLILTFVNPTLFSEIFLLLLFGKTIMDFPLLWYGTRHACSRKLLKYYLIFQPFHIVYIFITGILSQVTDVKWKNRQYRI